MPNWTYCELRCNDATDENGFWEMLKPFIAGRNADGEERELTYNVCCPCPQYIYHGDLGFAEEAKYGKSNCWYDWNIANWGVKWDACRVEASDGLITFDAPWGAPAIWFEELCRVTIAAGITGLELTCEYEDGGKSVFTQQDDGSMTEDYDPDYRCWDDEEEEKE